MNRRNFIKKALIFSAIFSNKAWATTFNGISSMNGLSMVEPSYLIPIGDSITLGINSTDGTGYKSKIFPLLINKTYRFIGTQINYRPKGSPVLTDGRAKYPDYIRHEGFSGSRSDQIETSITTDLPIILPNPINTGSIALVHVGTNDALQAVAAATAVQNVMDIIDVIKANDPNMAVYVALIVPNADDGAEDAKIITFNTALSTALTTKATTTAELYEVDINGAFKASGTWATDYFDVGDDTHPNDAGYAIIAQTFATSVIANE